MAPDTEHSFEYFPLLKLCAYGSLCKKAGPVSPPHAHPEQKSLRVLMPDLLGSYAPPHTTYHIPAGMGRGI